MTQGLLRNVMLLLPVDFQSTSSTIKQLSDPRMDEEGVTHHMYSSMSGDQ